MRMIRIRADRGKRIPTITFYAIPCNRVQLEKSITEPRTIIPLYRQHIVTFSGTGVPGLTTRCQSAK